MQKEKKLNLIGQLLLFSATLAWGSSFVILKETIQEVPAFFVIGIRFLIAGIVLGLIFIKKLLKINKKTFWQSVILGAVVAGAYLTQTWGLQHTTPGRNAFLTSTYCIMCPFIMWLFFKKLPKIYNVISAVLCLIGIGLVALTGSGSEEGGNLLLGDGLTLVGAVFFSLQIICIDRFEENKADPIHLLIVQFFVVGIILLISSAIFELPFVGIGAYALNTEQILKIGYLTLACTLFAQGAQIFGQKFISSPGQASLILSLEAVFGVIFSIIIGDEKLTLPLVIGFIVIFISIIISEMRLDPTKLFRSKSEERK